MFGLAIVFAVAVQVPVLARGKLECGVATVFPRKESDKQLFIFEGDDVPLGMFPWIGYLVYGDPRKYAECTVTLVKPRWLVTAAHCVLGECAKKASVILGTVRREDAKPKNIYKVAQIFHPKVTAYAKNKHVPMHDIAVIKLEKDVDISGSNGTINMICLPKSKQELKGTMFLSGWGLTAEDALNPADSLKYIKAEVIDNSNCFDDETKFCVQGHKKESTPFKGDSGGPAQMYINGRYYLQGALSGGNKTVALYTTVKNYIDWITSLPDDQTIDLTECKPKKPSK